MTAIALTFPVLAETFITLGIFLTPSIGTVVMPPLHSSQVNALDYMKCYPLKPWVLQYIRDG